MEYESNNNCERYIYIFFFFLSIIVFEAKDLKPYDSALMGGKADPYLKLCINNICHSTRVQHSTLNPKWDEEFKLYLIEKQNNQIF